MRSDWALLLPLAEAPVTEAILADAYDGGPSLGSLGLADTWRSADSATGPAPLVVSRRNLDVPGRYRGPERSLAELARLVAPGGVLYVELPRRQLRASVRTLERAGLHVNGLYGIAPDASSPRRYLPLDSTDALTWYTRDLVVAATPVHRLGQAALTAALRIAGGGARALVRSRFSDVALVATGDEERRDRSFRAVLTSGQDIGSRSIVVWFRGNGSGPSAVTKVAMRPEGFEATRRESARTDALRRSLPFSLASAIPRPTASPVVPLGLAVSETTVDGPSLQVLASRWGRPLGAKTADLRAAVDWLVAFGNTTAVVGGIEAPAWMRVFEEAADIPSQPALVRALLRGAAERLAAAPRCHRSVHVHGDAGPWNVHTGRLGRRRIGVIDWEHDGSRPLLGPPLVDVIYLVTHWYFAAQRVSGLAAERQALIDLVGPRAPRNRVLRAARETLQWSAHRSGLAASDVLPLTVALWATQAVDVRARRHRLGLDEPTEPTRADGHLLALATVWTGRTTT